VALTSKDKSSFYELSILNEEKLLPANLLWQQSIPRSKLADLQMEAGVKKNYVDNTCPPSQYEKAGAKYSCTLWYLYQLFVCVF